MGGGVGGFKCQLSVKILVICQLSVKFWPFVIKGPGKTSLIIGPTITEIMAYGVRGGEFSVCTNIFLGLCHGQKRKNA